MASIDFTVTHDFAASSQVVWEEMIAWERHAAWIPATTMEIDPGDSRAVGGTFTGYTGYGPIKLVDKMRVNEISWDEEASAGSCEVEKLGPVLRGQAGFTVTPSGSGSRVDWFERVTVPYLPQFLAPIVNRLAAFGFKMGMKSLAKVIAKK